MKKTLISLFALSLLAACGGGGGGGASPAPATDNTSKLDNTSTPAGPHAGATTQDAAARKAAAIARFNACPTVIGSQSPEASQCLTGTYTGTDLFTQESCTVKISDNGAVEASRGALHFQSVPPYTASAFNKATYSPISGTSPLGYIIAWAAAGGGERGTASSIGFNFNVQYDEKLNIEVKQGHPATNDVATISCGIEL